MAWSGDDTLQLIEEFKNQENLWNPASLEYGSRQSRNDSWQYIISVTNRPLHDVRRRINSLLAAYRRARMIERKTGEMPSWKYYENFSFMNKRYQHSNLDESELIDISDQSNDDSEILGDISKMNYNGQESELCMSDVPKPGSDTQQLNRENSFFSNHNQQMSQKQRNTTNNNNYIQVPSHERSSSNVPSANHQNTIPQISSSIPQVQTPLEHQSTSMLSDVSCSDLNQSNKTSVQTNKRPMSKDVCDAYGNYVASKLRNYPEKAKNMV